MKLMRRLAICAAAVACIGLAAPLAIHAKETAPAKTKAESRKEKRKKSPTAEKKAQHADANRDVWLERARKSDFLLGKASYYSSEFHNKKTASGVGYDMYTFTAAHRTLPIGTVVRVTDEQSGKSVMVCVTDRGPFTRGRIIDLSYAAADKIDMRRRGVGNVRLEVVSDADGTPLSTDEAYYVRFRSLDKAETVGPFRAFADAAAMHEAMRQAHPDAEVILEKAQ
ncbi:septal ring lytic transglycosylase RlpA family protein [uncultured Desulfovibrio sp.]|uniref:septal ring lytic transglycosylase RlpA family protein n=1 Tax=uncultured Desulfovibrio sp. TaxID=167968 RepID=UPI00260373A7|nr:septal ring lytic transglycosylase RlpA family protein [uncultured Desulfovibrio sp.]